MPVSPLSSHTAPYWHCTLRHGSATCIQKICTQCVIWKGNVCCRAFRLDNYICNFRIMLNEDNLDNRTTRGRICKSALSYRGLQQTDIVVLYSSTKRPAGFSLCSYLLARETDPCNTQRTPRLYAAYAHMHLCTDDMHWGRSEGHYRRLAIA